MISSRKRLDTALGLEYCFCDLRCGFCKLRGVAGKNIFTLKILPTFQKAQSLYAICNTAMCFSSYSLSSDDRLFSMLVVLSLDASFFWPDVPRDKTLLLPKMSVDTIASQTYCVIVLADGKPMLLD